MNKSIVTKIGSEVLYFNTGETLYSSHEQDCCENHYLSFEHLTLSDFEDLEFDLSDDNFFEKIGGYGIALKPIKGFPVRIPGYGYNNGYYSTELTLILEDSNKQKREFDITECQEIDG